MLKILILAHFAFINYLSEKNVKPNQEDFLAYQVTVSRTYDVYENEQATYSSSYQIILYKDYFMSPDTLLDFSEPPGGKRLVHPPKPKFFTLKIGNKSNPYGIKYSSFKGDLDKQLITDTSTIIHAIQLEALKNHEIKIDTISLSSEVKQSYLEYIKLFENDVKKMISAQGISKKKISRPKLSDQKKNKDKKTQNKHSQNHQLNGLKAIDYYAYLVFVDSNERITDSLGKRIRKFEHNGNILYEIEELKYNRNAVKYDIPKHQKFRYYIINKHDTIGKNYQIKSGRINLIGDFSLKKFENLYKFSDMYLNAYTNIYRVYDNYKLNSIKQTHVLKEEFSNRNYFPNNADSLIHIYDDSLNEIDMAFSKALDQVMGKKLNTIIRVEKMIHPIPNNAYVFPKPKTKRYFKLRKVELNQAKANKYIKLINRYEKDKLKGITLQNKPSAAF